MKRLHLEDGIIERSEIPARPKIGEVRENNMASYIYVKTGRTITVLKNRYGDRGEITRSEHSNFLHRQHNRNIIPFGNFRIKE